MRKVLFGTAGIPMCCEGDTAEGIATVKRIGLDAMELEFTHSVNMKEPMAEHVRKTAIEQGVVLTVHGPYYINLASHEKQKIHQSERRIIESARIGAIAGAESVTFHPAFYGKRTVEETTKMVEHSLIEILALLRDKRIKTIIAPETTGKISQFGTIEELLELCRRVDGLKLCVDFCHLHARGNGCLKKKEDFIRELEKIEKFDSRLLERLHMQTSGVAYTEKGERAHLPLEESDFNYKALMEALKEMNVGGILICESPNIETDALKMKKYYESLA